MNAFVKLFEYGSGKEVWLKSKLFEDPVCADNWVEFIIDKSDLKKIAGMGLFWRNDMSVCKISVITWYGVFEFDSCFLRSEIPVERNTVLLSWANYGDTSYAIRPGTRKKTKDNQFLYDGWKSD